jgi:choline dehydrogenase-like flavoprotein
MRPRRNRLTRKGFDVVVLEQGTAFGPEDMERDEIGAFVTARWTNKAELQPQTYRKTVDEVAKKRQYVSYARAVDGTTFHITGNYWRFRPIDFHEFSVRGGVPGAAMANWPITYEELEPYHTAVEYAVGVSGETSHAPGEPMRSKPYPVPPINVHAPGVLLEVGAKKLGWSSKAANGAETPRLLLMSTSKRVPDGLANASGMVGKHFMFNGGAISNGEFEHEIQAHAPSSRAAAGSRP